MNLLNSLLVATLPYVPKCMVGFVARRYIAGNELKDVVVKCRELNQKKAMGTIDLLGESVTTKEATLQCVQKYIEIWDTIHGSQLDANVSLKPTSFGAIFDESLCIQNIRTIIEKAASLGSFVRIDMENHPYTDLTLKMYAEFRKTFPKHVGTVLQAYLKRSYDDADLLTKDGSTNIRLCKGIYNEPEAIAYKKKQEINDSYLKILELLLSRKAYVGIATHDEKLVEGAFGLIQKYGLYREEYEFQMLLGVRPELRDSILQKGHRLRIYIPFGKDWYPYSIRRLRENPSIAMHVAKAFFTRNK